MVYTTASGVVIASDGLPHFSAAVVRRVVQRVAAAQGLTLPTDFVAHLTGELLLVAHEGSSR